MTISEEKQLAATRREQLKARREQFRARMVAGGKCSNCLRRRAIPRQSLCAPCTAALSTPKPKPAPAPKPAPIPAPVPVAQPQVMEVGPRCEVCASLPTRMAHDCAAVHRIFGVPICQDCADGRYHWHVCNKMYRAQRRCHECSAESCSLRRKQSELAVC